MAEPSRSSKPFWRRGAGRLAAPIVASLALLLGEIGQACADSAQYFYDPAGRLVAVVDPINGSAQYTYDAVGNVLSVVRKPITDIVVAQVSPSRGPASTVVTIFGTGFGTTSDTTVSFNGQPATPTAVSATQITVAVPSGATTGPVSVTSPAGSATSVASFTVPVLGVPAISGVSPSQVDPGGTITITGSGFDPLPANNKVFVNGRYAQLTAVTASTLTAVVPAVSSGRVSIITPEGAATSANYLVVPPSPYLASSIGAVVTTSVGGTATTTLGTAGKIGLILFEATAGQRLAMRVTASSFGSAALQLFRPDGGPIGSSISISNGTFIDTQVLPRSGTYAVLVAPGSTSTGSATINLIDVPPDVSGTIAANAPPVPLTTTVPGQNMSLSFTGAANQRVGLRVQADSALTSACYTVTLLQPNGTTQVYNQFLCLSSRFSDVLILPVAGSYTIRLNPSGAGTGTATFTLYDVPPDVSGTIAANATPVPLTTTVPGQNMSLSFTGAANQRVGLRTQANSGLSSVCFAVTLLQPNGTTQVYNQLICLSSTFSDVLILPVAGSYTIRLNPEDMGTGTATFTLYDVPPDVSGTIAANATPVPLTTTVPGQNMSLSFTGAANQRVGLRVQADSALSSACYTVTLLQPDGTTQVYNQLSCGSSIFSEVLILPVAGSYTIRLNPEGIGTGTATFTLYDVPPDVSGTIAANATPVSLTTPTPGQNMSLSFTGAANQRVSLRVQADSALSSACYTVTLLQPNGTTQVYNQTSCSSSIFSDVLILPVAGSYTIRLNPSGLGTGTATFTLYDMPADASATITPGGGSVSLTTTVPGQNMSLSFTGAANQRVGLLTQADSGLSSPCYTVTLLQPNGTTQVYNQTSCSSSVFSDVLILSVAGSYTIRLNPSGTGTGTATFTLYDVPADVMGTTSVGQAAANYDVTVPGQAIRVSFTGTASQNISVSVGRVSSTPTGACYNITTLKPDGSTLRGDSSCSSGYSSGALTPPVAGTYTVVVDPTSASIGTFSVGVVTP